MARAADLLGRAGVVALAVRAEPVRGAPARAAAGPDQVECGREGGTDLVEVQRADAEVAHPERRDPAADGPGQLPEVGVDWAIPLCSTTTSSGTRHSYAMLSAS